MKKMLVLVTNIVLLGSAGIAGAGELAGPVRLTAMQMDKITAGANLNLGDMIIFQGKLVRVELHNLGFFNSLGPMIYVPCNQCICPPTNGLPVK